LPRITRASEATRTPYRALLSAFMHLGAPDGGAIALAAVEGTAHPSDEAAHPWREVSIEEIWSNEALQPLCSDVMDRERVRAISTLSKQGKREGRGEGKAEGSGRGGERRCWSSFVVGGSGCRRQIVRGSKRARSRRCGCAGCGRRRRRSVWARRCAE
jgi:hypothetical protein